MNRLRPEVGSSIAVFGAGAVGLSAVMAAKVAGSTTIIIAVDLKPGRLDLATELGATHTINGGATDTVNRIQEITGRGADYTVDTTAVSAVARQAVRPRSTSIGRDCSRSTS